MVELTLDEARDLRRLRPVPGAAREFWGRACAARGLDPDTLLLTEEYGHVLALPLGHGRHWCWPLPLRCKDPPPPWGDDD